MVSTVPDDFMSTTETISESNVTQYCTLFPDNPHQCDVVIGIRRAMASLSLIGCVFMISVIWLFKKYVAFAQRLILYLSITALMDSFAYLLGGLYPEGPLCTFQAFWLSYFDWTVLLWISCITFNLFMNAVKLRSTEKFEWAYHLLCWGFPLLMSCLPFIGHQYGPAGAWCWIKEDWIWRFGIWYAPLFIIIAVMFAIYIYIIITMTRKASRWEGTYDPDTERNKQMMKEDIKPLRAYPFIYLALSIFPLINRIQNAASPGTHVFALVVLASLTVPLQGAVNAIVFGMDRETFSRLTPTQIKVAALSHFNRQAVREFPVSYRNPESLSPTPKDPMQSPKFNNVTYSRLH